MNINTVTVVGVTGTMGANVAGIFASFGDAKVYCVGRDIEKVKRTIPRIVKSVRADAIAKNLVEIKDGDTIDLLCDYYDYSGNYSASYHLGTQIVVDGETRIGDVELPDAAKAQAAYIFTDIFGQEYWTPVIPR